VSELVREIDAERKQRNLSSAIRLFVLGYYRSRAVAVGDQPKPEAYSLNGH
jgi:predicted DNA-binding ribbon-helix-helix protein